MKCNAYHVFFKNLANPLKTQIISALKEKPLSVTELMLKINIEQSKLSHALISLKFCKIVNSKQQGKQRIYSLNKKTILPILKIIDKHKQTMCPGCRK
jgi:ArsR family transcriptional regulator, zinc-responsive transcriptional repressor